MGLKNKDYGKVSDNIVEKVVEIVPNLYTKAETVIKETTNITLSHEAIRNLVVKVENKFALKEKEERKLYNKKQLISRLKEITSLWEEADGLWINLQGKTEKNGLEKQKKECEKKNKEFNPKAKIKTELKLHVMYEGWKKDDPRHSLVNKKYIPGIMKSKEIAELRDVSTI